MDLDSALTGKPAEGAGATDILRADHREVRRLFTEFEAARGDAHARAALAQALCMQIELHDALEREVFYPAARECDAQRVRDAEHDHETIAAASERVRMRADGGDALEQAVSELKARIEPHVAREESELFPAVEARGTDWLRKIGEALVCRKEQLTRSTESFEGPAT